MKYNSSFCLPVLLAILLTQACNDPTVIGSDLLVNDQLGIEFTDTFSLRTYNQREDSVFIYNSLLLSNIPRLPLGNFQDPILGKSSSSIYMEVTRQSVRPNFVSGLLDSAVLILPYYARGSYGDLNEVYSLEVYQMAENFPDSSLYSNRDYAVGRLIGKIDYMPLVNDSVQLKVPGFPDSVIKVPPQLRIPLTENNFALDLFSQDSQTLTNVTDLRNFLKGVYIKPLSTNKGIPSFDLRNNSAGIQLYYHLDTVASSYLFPVFSSQVVTARFEHDYSTSIVPNLETDFIGELATYPDSLLFMQGMSGLSFVVEVPHSEMLANKIINKAELVFQIVTLPGDDPIQYLPAEQMLVSQVLDDGSFQLVNDFVLARRQSFNDFAAYFGGIPRTDNTYRVNITNHLQDMSRGLVTEKMLVSMFLKAEQAFRVVLGGSGNSAAKARLEVTFTNF